MTLVKICGMTNLDDALEAVRLGADMLGFVLYAKSKRFIDPAAAGKIIAQLPPAVGRVGVFVDEDADRVRHIARSAALTALQFHGDETPAYCAGFAGSYRTIKAFRIRDRKSLASVNEYRTDYYLFDADAGEAKGGGGKAFDRRIIADFECLRPVILSGGLTPATVGAAIREVAPYGVDVATGVEKAPGIKDHLLMKQFIAEVRKAD